ncbi:MAG: restriction endonuclease subunit S [Bacteroidales bacterium]|nr:restriction endonuclease subunit S [Bacteroidales bacterium]
MNNWKKTTLGKAVLFNPTERIVKGAIAKKIAMDKIQSFTRMISGYELTEFSGGSKFRNGDTLLARITPCLENGKTAQVTILDDDEIGFGSTEYIVLREKENITDNNYIYYFSLNPSFRNVAIQSMVGSTGRQRVQQNVLENLEINLPPLDEQKRIADVLSALDDKIEVNNKINENLEAQAQAIFKQWFVDFEFPDKEGKPYKTNGGKFIDSELGEIPVGWKVDSADNIFNISIGKTPPRKEPIWFSKDKMDVTWVSISDMGREGVYISNSSEYLTRDAIKKFNVVVVPENTVLLSFKLTVGRISITDGEVTTNEAIAHFKTNNKTYTNYIYQYLKVYDYQSMGNTSSIANAVNSKIIKVMKIILPSDNILKDFYDIVNPIMISIKRNEQENQSLSEIRDSLLPKLMSGEVRV